MSKRPAAAAARARKGPEPRLWLITQWYAPEPVANPQIIADSLKSAGLLVHVITGYPNYPTGVVHAGYSARGFSSEEIHGIPVYRCPLYPSHGDSILGRVANYCTWAVSATLQAVARVRRRDVALVYSSPATAALPAMVCRLLFGTRFVLMIQDLWPESVLATGFVNRPAARRAATALIAPFVWLSYRLASHVTVISPGMIDVLVERGVPREKLSLTYNWADEEVYYPREAMPTFRLSHGIADDSFLVMYAGNLGPAQALDDVIRAVGDVRADSNVALVLVGSGVAEPELRDLAAQVAPGRIFFAPPIPPGEVSAAMAAADIQVVTLKDEPVFAHTMPSKVQSILASGQPIVAAASGDLRAAIVASGAGWTAASGAVDELTECIREASAASKSELLSRGLLGRKYYEETMSEAVNGRQLLSVLEGAYRVST